MNSQLGKDFAEALGSKDAVRLKALLRPDIDFRAMTPSRFWEATSADEVIDGILFGKWFEPSDEITEVVSIDTDSVAARQRVAYRFRVTNPDGRYLVEQQAYLDPDGDKIGWLRIMCTGYLPVD